MQLHFGLHNRENLDINGLEAVKLAIAVQYGLVGEKWVQFCNEIVDDPKAMLVCYGLQSRVTHWTDEQIKHLLALNALLIATFIDVGIALDKRPLWTFSNCSSWEDALCIQYRFWMRTVRSDLQRIENQIPFDLISKVVIYFLKELACGNANVNEKLDEIYSQYQRRSLEYVYNMFFSTFFLTSGEPFKISDDWSSSFDKQTHILGAALEVICGLREGEEYLSDWTQDPYIHIPSATELEQSGIKIVGVPGPLRNMSYAKKCLYLPKMIMHGNTTSLIQNLAWYESIDLNGKCLFNDHYRLMADLIRAPKDWKLLIKCGVIHDLDGKTDGFGKWSNFGDDMWIVPSSTAHNKTKKRINRRCERRRYKLWSEFKILFCSKPWLVLSTIAVILVTVATLVQTYISIIGSNKMKPKFP